MAPDWGLEELHMSYRDILDNIHEAIVIADTDNIVRYINASYTRLTGMRKEDMVGKPLLEVRPKSTLHQVVQTGKSQLGKHRFVDGIEFFSNIVPLYKDGRIVGGMSVSSNVTDLLNISEELERSRRTIDSLRKILNNKNFTRYSFDDLIGEDMQFRLCKQQAGKIADKDLSVMLVGDSGTGKEMFAQSIHNAGNRKYAPFIAVNCATLNAALLDSELFGYTPNAFTGAHRDGKKGVFEEAEGGTVFLDEIGELEERLQAKLLRTLQEGTVRPVGSSFEKPVDVRVISATNKDIFRMCQRNAFRRDLYYRLAQVQIELPGLRERRGDIMLLANRFLERFCAANRRSMRFGDDCAELLQSYDWPGNVRELYNCVRVVSVLCERDVIEPRDFPGALRRGGEAGARQSAPPPRLLKAVVRQAEREEIVRALALYGDDTNGKRLAAQALGISVASLYNKIKYLGMHAEKCGEPLD